MAKGDKLAKLRASQTRKIRLAECDVELVMKKWNLDQILRHGDYLVEVIKGLANSKSPDAVQKFLTMPLSKLLGGYKDQLLAIAANTLWYDYTNTEGVSIKFLENEFESDAEAKEFVTGLSAGDLLQLLKAIYEDNFVPFCQSLGFGDRKPLEILRLLQETKLPTSLTNSSEVAIVTKQ